MLLIVVAGGWLWWSNQNQFVLPIRATNAPVTQLPPAALPANPITAPTPQPKPVLATNTVTTTAPLAATNSALATTNKNGAFPRPPRDILEAQIALARKAISSGSVDGVMGSQTRAALSAFQRANALPVTGELDAPTRNALTLDSEPLTPYTVTSNDLARLQPLSKTWLGKSQQSALDYETILELVAERGHASPNLIRRLNPSVNWTNVPAATVVRIPAVEYPPPAEKAAFVVIRLAERRLQAFDAGTNLIVHFPCSIAARFEKRPVGELRVTAIADKPDYTFNPGVFPESEEARQLKTKLILPPGPNNPVGTAWISLDRPGYGMHGTPSPEQVGRTESHGCFRLANWNADYLVKLAWVGMPVRVEP